MNMAQKESIAGLLEAALFACGDPIEISRLAAGLSLETAAVREQLELYAARLQKSDRGLELLMLGDSVQLCSKRRYEERIAAVLNSRKNAPLSGAAMEVLANLEETGETESTQTEETKEAESDTSSEIRKEI